MSQILTGPFDDIQIPSGALTRFVLRHASRLADRPALVDGMTARTGGTVTTINPAYFGREIAHQLVDSRQRSSSL